MKMKFKIFYFICIDSFMSADQCYSSRQFFETLKEVTVLFMNILLKQNHSIIIKDLLYDA